MYLNSNFSVYMRFDLFVIPRESEPIFHGNIVFLEYIENDPQEMGQDSDLRSFGLMSTG